jgi:hypothetical protein
MRQAHWLSTLAISTVDLGYISYLHYCCLAGVGYYFWSVSAARCALCCMSAAVADVGRWMLPLFVFCRALPLLSDITADVGHCRWFRYCCSDMATQMRWRSPSCSAPMLLLRMSSFINALISLMAFATAMVPSAFDPVGGCAWCLPSVC